MFAASECSRWLDRAAESLPAGVEGQVPIDRAWPIVSVQKRAMKLPMGAMGSTANSQRLPRAFRTACLLIQLRNRATDAAAARMLVG